MTYPKFFTYLAVTTAVAALVAWLAHMLLPIDYALGLTVASFILMMLLTVVIFYVGKRTASAENKFLFGNAFMGATLVKMFFGAGAMVAYTKLAAPPNNLFIVPFFSTYFLFTIYEVIFLVMLAGEAQQVAKAEEVKPTA